MRKKSIPEKEDLIRIQADDIPIAKVDAKGMVSVQKHDLAKMIKIKKDSSDSDVQFVCHSCQKLYTRKCKSYEEAMATNDLVERESWLSGLCPKCQEGVFQRPRKDADSLPIPRNHQELTEMVSEYEKFINCKGRLYQIIIEKTSAKKSLMLVKIKNEEDSFYICIIYQPDQTLFIPGKECDESESGIIDNVDVFDTPEIILTHAKNNLLDNYNENTIFQCPQDGLVLNNPKAFEMSGMQIQTFFEALLQAQLSRTGYHNDPDLKAQFLAFLSINDVMKIYAKWFAKIFLISIRIHNQNPSLMYHIVETINQSFQLTLKDFEFSSYFYSRIKPLFVFVIENDLRYSSLYKYTKIFDFDRLLRLKTQDLNSPLIMDAKYYFLQLQDRSNVEDVELFLNYMQQLDIFLEANYSDIYSSDQKLDAQERSNPQLNETTLMTQAKQDPLHLVFAFRLHLADKKGPHLDLCLGLESEPTVADFVIPKCTSLQDLLAIEGKVLAIPMIPHDTDPYLSKSEGFSKPLLEGYGKGTWTIIAKGTAVQKGDHRSFTLSHPKFTLQFYHRELTVWYLAKLK